MAVRSRPLKGSAQSIINYLKEDDSIAPDEPAQTLGAELVFAYLSNAQVDDPVVCKLVTGGLSDKFRLDGKITQEQFTRLCQGQHPETGEQLVATNTGYARERDKTAAKELANTLHRSLGIDMTTANSIAYAAESTEVRVVAPKPPNDPTEPIRDQTLVTQNAQRTIDTLHAQAAVRADGYRSYIATQFSPRAAARLAAAPGWERLERVLQQVQAAGTDPYTALREAISARQIDYRKPDVAEAVIRRLRKTHGIHIDDAAFLARERTAAYKQAEADPRSMVVVKQDPTMKPKRVLNADKLELLTEHFQTTYKVDRPTADKMAKKDGRSYDIVYPEARYSSDTKAQAKSAQSYIREKANEIAAADLATTVRVVITPPLTKRSELDDTLVQREVASHIANNIPPEEALKTARANPLNTVRVIEDQQLKPIKILNEWKAGVLTQHFTATRLVSETTARQMAEADGRAYDISAPEPVYVIDEETGLTTKHIPLRRHAERYEIDEARRAAVEQTALADNMDPDAAYELSLRHPLSLIHVMEAGATDRASLTLPGQTLTRSAELQVKTLAAAIAADSSGQLHDQAAEHAARETGPVIRHEAPKASYDVYRVDEGRNGRLAKVTAQLLSDEYHQERIAKETTRLIADENLTPEAAQATAERTVVRFDNKTARQLARAHPLSQMKFAERDLRPSVLEWSWSTDKSFAEWAIWIKDAMKTKQAQGLSFEFEERMFNGATKAFEETTEILAHYFEEHALLARPGYQAPSIRTDKHAESTKGGRTRRVAAKLSVSRFIQWTARATPTDVARGYGQAPHPHCHFATPNIGWVPDDKHPDGGSFLSLDDWGLKKLAAELENLGKTVLAQKLTDIGIQVEWETNGKGVSEWHFKGSNKDIRAYLSTRSEEVHQTRLRLEAEKERLVSVHEVQDEMRKNRAPKTAEGKIADSVLETDDLAVAMKRDGFFPTFPDVFAERVRIPLEERRQLLIDYLDSTEGLCKNAAFVTADEIRPHVLRANTSMYDDSLQPDELASFLDVYKSQLVELRNNEGKVFYTTEGQLDRETELDRLLVELSRLQSPPADRNRVTKALNSVTDGDGKQMILDNEQTSAFYSAVSGQRLTVVDGWAGTGKSTTGKAIVAATTGQTIVVSVSATTALNTANSIRADRGMSIFSFNDRTAKGLEKLGPNDRIIVDEYAMANTEQLLGILKGCGQAQVTMFGDKLQMTAIGPAGWIKRLPSRVVPHELTAVHRQPDKRDQQALKDVRQGHGERALQNLLERDLLHIAKNGAESLDQMRKKYIELRQSGLTADEVRIIIDTSNKAVDDMNRLIQNYRIKAKEISAEHFDVHDTESARRWSLHEGEEVVFLTAVRDPNKRQAPVRNGTPGRIISLDTKAAIAKVQTGDRVITVHLEHTRKTQQLGIATAQHAAKFQGNQVRAELYRPAPPDQASLNKFYSAATRFKQTLHVFADEETHAGTDGVIATIAESIRRDDLQDSAIALLEPTDPAAYYARTGVRPSVPSHADVAVRKEAERRDQYQTALAAKLGPGKAEWVLSSGAFGALDRQLQKRSVEGHDPVVVLEGILERHSFPENPREVRDPAALLASWVRYWRPDQVGPLFKDFEPEPFDPAQAALLVDETLAAEPDTEYIARPPASSPTHTIAFGHG